MKHQGEEGDEDSEIADGESDAERDEASAAGDRGRLGPLDGQARGPAVSDFWLDGVAVARPGDGMMQRLLAAVLTVVSQRELRCRDGRLDRIGWKGK